jgi:hypothetical protein
MHHHNVPLRASLGPPPPPPPVVDEFPKYNSNDAVVSLKTPVS